MDLQLSLAHSRSFLHEGFRIDFCSAPWGGQALEDFLPEGSVSVPHTK